jgi:hypothetical protein
VLHEAIHARILRQTLLSVRDLLATAGPFIALAAALLSSRTTCSTLRRPGM